MYTIFYWACGYLSMLGLKLNHVSKGDPSQILWDFVKNHVWNQRRYITLIPVLIATVAGALPSGDEQSMPRDGLKYHCLHLEWHDKSYLEYWCLLWLGVDQFYPYFSGLPQRNLTQSYEGCVNVTITNPSTKNRCLFYRICCIFLLIMATHRWYKQGIWSPYWQQFYGGVLVVMSYCVRNK